MFCAHDEREPFGLFIGQLYWQDDCTRPKFYLMQSRRDTILKRLRAALPDLRREFLVRGMALFGSAARNEITDGSDVDILVDVDPAIGLGFVILAERLERAVGRKVDLISSRALKPELRKLIEPELIDV